VNNLDLSYCFCDLLNHKIITMTRRFMVEKNSIAHKQAITLLVIDHILVCYNFQNNIKNSRMEHGSFSFHLSTAPFWFPWKNRVLLSPLRIAKLCLFSKTPIFFKGLPSQEGKWRLHNVDKCNASTFWGLEQQKWFWWWGNNLHIVNVHAINHLGPKTKCELMFNIIPLLRTIITSGHQALVQFANKFTLLNISRF
jgi:hypothetical protein